jgi:hypothetical protein
VDAASVDRWNRDCPVGTPVRAWPGTLGGGRYLDTSTRTRAWLLGGHTAVVSVDGYAGGIALTHVQVRQADVSRAEARRQLAAGRRGGCSWCRSRVGGCTCDGWCGRSSCGGAVVDREDAGGTRWSA